MNKILYIFFLFSICFFSCTKSITVPSEFNYKEVSSGTYTLACWQKISNENSPFHIYIEGDGNSFNRYGYPTDNPTPKGTFLREIAFNDPNDNVIYLARPGQFVENQNKNQTDWTTGRFSKKIVDSVSQAVNELSKGNPIILIGYSGGALLSGLIINENPNLNVIKWITIAGVLNHTKWTEKLNLPPLKDSLDLDYLPKVKQIHLVGEKDKIVPAELTKSIVCTQDLIIVPKATHNTGFEKVYNIIYCVDER